MPKGILDFIIGIDVTVIIPGTQQLNHMHRTRILEMVSDVTHSFRHKRKCTIATTPARPQRGSLRFYIALDTLCHLKVYVRMDKQDKLRLRTTGVHN